MTHHIRTPLLLIIALLMACPVAASEDALEGDRPGGSEFDDKVVQGSVTAPVELVDRVPGTTPNLAAAFALRAGDPHLLFLDENGRITYRAYGTDQRLDEDVVVPGGRFLGIHALPEGVFATWWQKRDDARKDLYVRRLGDFDGDGFGPAVKVNSGFGVLPTYALVSDGEGRLAIVYHDERVHRYGIYVNVSHDGGATWLETDIRLDGPADHRGFAIEPFAIYADGRLVVTWREKALDASTTRFMTRYSDDGGVEWSAPLELGSFATGFFTSDVLLLANGSPLVLGYVTEKGLFGYRADDGGIGWAPLPVLAGTEDLSELSQTVAVAHEGVAIVAFTVTPHGRNELGRRYNPRTFVARFDLDSGAWLGEAQRLDRGKELDLTTAKSPALAMTESGVLIAAWEDYRDIRANVYLSRSLDLGATWSDPVPATEPGRHVVAFPRLIAEGNQVYLLYDRFADDARRRRSLTMLPLGLEGAGITELGDHPELSVEARMERLAERMEELWRLRAASDHAAAYEFFDPAFRGAVHRDAFVVSQGNIRYLDYEVLGVQVWGSIGAALSRVKVEVPQLRIDGEEFQLDPREDVLSMEWVWIDDEWYVVMEATGDTRFLTY